MMKSSRIDLTRCPEHREDYISELKQNQIVERKISRVMCVTVVWLHGQYSSTEHVGDTGKIGPVIDINAVVLLLSLHLIGHVPLL